MGLAQLYGGQLDAVLEAWNEAHMRELRYMRAPSWGLPQ